MKLDDLRVSPPARAAEWFPALSQKVHGHPLVYLDGAASIERTPVRLTTASGVVCGSGSS